MSWKSKTGIFIVVTTVLIVASWIIYDIYALAKGGTEASISHLIYEWSFKYPFFTFMVGFSGGVLSGHFFWRIRRTETTDKMDKMSRS